MMRSSRFTSHDQLFLILLAVSVGCYSLNRFFQVRVFALPAMVIMAPRDEEELRRMLRAALAYDAGPIALRFARGAVAGVAARPTEEMVAIGKGELLRRGADASLVAVGSMVRVADGAADILARSGVDVSVVDAKFVKPLDAGLILSVAASGAPVFALEENAVTGGFGEAVLELCAGRGLANRISVLGIPDVFVPHGTRAELLREIGLTPEGVAAAVERSIGSRRDAGQGGIR